MAWYGRLSGGDATAAVGLSWRRHFGIPLNRLIAVVCAAAVATLWLTTLQRIDFERQQAVDAAQQSNANLAIAFEQQVFRTLKAAEQVAAFVRERYAHHGAAINLPHWVNERVIRDAMFNIVSVVDADGEIVSSSVNTGRISYADREFFLVQKNSQADTLYVNPPVIGRVTGRWQVPMSLRISEPDGRFGGVVVMSVDPGSFTHFYRQADLGGQGLLELTGLDGIVRARVVGSEGSFGADAAGLPWYRRHVDEAVGSLIDDGAAVDGVARLVSYRTMADYPLMVTVGTAYAAELAPAMQRRSTYLASASLGTAMLLVGAGLLMFVLARQRAVTEAQRASEALFRATFHQAAMGIALIAPDGIIRRVNDKFSRMLGYDADALCGRSLFDLVVEDNRAAARQFLHHRLSVYSPVYSPEIEKPYRRSDGTILWVCEALGVVKTADGRPDFLVAVAQDITARKDLEARLSHDALHDALTGLPNRVMFRDRLMHALASARRYDKRVAVLYLDLDGFKEVNDTHGHGAGDVLLQQVAQRLQRCVRAEDTVARLGGDEFGIVLAQLSGAEDCRLVACKIIQALSEPFHHGGVAACISASVGGALYPDHGTELNTLIAHADSAMYAAKMAGKNRFSQEPPPRTDIGSGG